MTEPISTDAAASAVDAAHSHTHLHRVNDHEVSLAVNTVPYPWHRHPESDEMLLVLQGNLTVEFRGAPLAVLRPGDIIRIPAGQAHRTIPEGKTVNLIVRREGSTTEFE